jgi:hypothetical protein
VLSVVAACLAANIALLAARYARSPAAVLAIALLLALTNPLFSFSLLIFPEMTSALCIAYAARRLLASGNAAWQWFVVGCCAAALPWLHYRLAPICIVFAVIAAIRFRGEWTPKLVLAAGTAPVVSAGVLLWWYQRLYGRPLPPASDHAGFSGAVGTLNGLAGTFLDQQWGAFIHNPLLLLAAAAFAPFAWARRADGAILAAVVLPYLFVIANYRVWWGEWNPPARYLTDVVPLAAAPLAWWLDGIGRRARWAAVSAFTLPAVAVMATFVANPQRMYNQPVGTSRLFETWRDWTGVDLTNVVPSYVFYSASSAGARLLFGLLGFAWLGTLATLAWVLIFPATPPSERSDAR